MKLTVDADKCTMCGWCIPTCPSEMVRSKGDFIKIGRVACIECGHCAAICPTGAIVDEEGGGLASTPVSAVEPEALTDLMRTRRTVRRYTDEPVLREEIEAILQAAAWVPTAANCQPQEYVVLTDPAQVAELREKVEAHYRAFGEALADKDHREARLAALGADPQTATHPHMLAAVPAFVKAVDAGRDRLFFDAPVVIVIHAADDQVMPESACHYATFAITLAAWARGLGTCVTGYASDALRIRPDLREHLGIRPGNQVHAVVVLGHPAEDFTRIPARRPPLVDWR